MSKKIICVNGDSYTEEYHLGEEHRWSTALGASHNLAIAGASNDRIFQTTIDYLNDNTPDILIIGWTDWSRFMLPCEKGSRYFITPHHTGLELSSENQDGSYVGKFYYTHLHNDYTNFKNMLNYMLHLQSYCKVKNIKLLFFFSVVDDRWLNEHTIAEISQNTEQEDELRRLIEKIDETIWIKEKFYSMNKHCQGYATDDTFHFLEEGSRHWAKLVGLYL